MFESPRRNSVRSALLVLLFLLIAAVNVQAQNSAPQKVPMIFDVRRSLPMEPTEPVYHDFYINAGIEAGLKKGMYITVVRFVPVHDPVHNVQQGELQVGVARLQVIQTAQSLSVARLHSEFSNEERPTLEFEAVMIGDRIDPELSTMETPKAKPKKRVALEAEAPAQTVVTVPAVDPAIVVSTAVPPVAETAPAVVTTPAAPAPGSVTLSSEAMPGTPASEPQKNASQPVNRADIVRLPVPAVPGSVNVGAPTVGSTTPTL